MGVLCACMLVMGVDVSLWCVCVIYVVSEGVYVQSWALAHFSRYRTLVLITRSPNCSVLRNIAKLFGFPKSTLSLVFP